MGQCTNAKNVQLVCTLLLCQKIEGGGNVEKKAISTTATPRCMRFLDSKTDCTRADMLSVLWLAYRVSISCAAVESSLPMSKVNCLSIPLLHIYPMLPCSLR